MGTFRSTKEHLCNIHICRWCNKGCGGYHLSPPSLGPWSHQSRWCWSYCTDFVMVGEVIDARVEIGALYGGSAWSIGWMGSSRSIEEKLEVNNFTWRVNALWSLSTYTACKLNILWHDSDAFGMNRTQVCILKETHKVGFWSFLKR